MSFPVLGHLDGIDIITTFTDAAGIPVKQVVIFPGNTLTLTNLDSGTSVTVVATGSFQLRAEPGGSVSARVTGDGSRVFLPPPDNRRAGDLEPERPSEGTFDSHGNMTSAKVMGKLVDLCAQLSSLDLEARTRSMPLANHPAQRVSPLDGSGESAGVGERMNA